MGNIVETREYVDGERTLKAQILDNGCVAFTTGIVRATVCSVHAAVSSTVLRQLADLADAAKVATSECSLIADVDGHGVCICAKRGSVWAP